MKTCRIYKTVGRYLQLSKPINIYIMRLDGYKVMLITLCNVLWSLCASSLRPSTQTSLYFRSFPCPKRPGNRCFVKRIIIRILTNVEIVQIHLHHLWSAFLQVVGTNCRMGFSDSGETFHWVQSWEGGWHNNIWSRLIWANVLQ